MYKPKIFKPISEQWSLMLAYIVLIGWDSLLSNPFPKWFIIFFQAYVVAALTVVRYSKVKKAIFYVIIYLLFACELTLDWVFNMHISPSILVLLAETNSRESSEFLRALVDKPEMRNVLLCFVGMIMLNIWAEHSRSTVTTFLSRNRKAHWLKGLSILFLVTGLIMSASYLPLFTYDKTNQVDEWCNYMRHPKDATTRLFVSVIDINIARQEMEEAIIQAERVNASPQTQSTTDSLNVILVIGESYIREHTPLYGYPLQTTPFLSHEKQAGRLFAFNDVVSPYNQTTKVIRNILSVNSLGNNENWRKFPPLTAIFKRNGYHVAIYDNQKTCGLADMFAFSLNTYLYHPRMQHACYNEQNDSTFEYDGDLISHYRRQTAGQTHTRQLLLFHLMGQHVAFAQRYPQQYAHFTANSINFRHEKWLTSSMKEEIAHYDNATRYNDDVLRQICELYGQENTVVVYLSDHGEEVYDYREKYGRDDFGLGDSPCQLLRYQYAVPFMVWCSDKYIKNHPQTIEALRQSLDNPLMLDNTCHLLFHLSDLRTPYYRPVTDVLSPNYHCPKRIVNDQVDYDSIMTSRQKFAKNI